MNWKDLYQKGEVNGDTVFYTDENCEVPFTGHVEYYFKDKLSWECDIVNGLREGLEKEYYDFTGELERIGEIQNNRAYTIIDVGDRGDWMCTVHSKSKSYKDIAFYDGEFEEVYERLLKHF